MAAENPSMFKNPFHLLDMPIQMDLCMSTLEAHYLERASQAHPDRFTLPFEKNAATQKSADLNTAYQALKHPLSRAAAILWAHDMAVPGVQNHTVLDAEILEETMHWQEAIAQWKMNPARAQSTIQQIHQSLSKLYTDLIQTFDMQPKAAWGKIYTRLCYLDKLQQRCQEETPQP